MRYSESESKIMDELIEKVVFEIIDYSAMPIGNNIHCCPKCGRNGEKHNVRNFEGEEFIKYFHKMKRGFRDEIIDFCEIDS